MLRSLDVEPSLKALPEGDQEEQRDSFEFLKQALEQDRPSYRKLFQSLMTVVLDAGSLGMISNPST